MTTYQVFNDQQSAVSSLADADSLPVYDASAGVMGKATVAQVRAAMGGVVATTATTLSVTAASHAGKTIVINSAAPIAVSMPAATGTGNVYKFKIGVAATGTSHTISANGTDVTEGIVLALTTSSANVIGYASTATSDSLVLNGTTQGGVAGDLYTWIDAESGVWQVNGVTQATGSTASPFAAT